MSHWLRSFRTVAFLKVLLKWYFYCDLQPYLQARGPAQPSSDQRRSLEDIFQGGDVQPDSDPGYEVIDGAGSDGGQNDVEVKDNHKDSSDNQCPRCLRTFKQTEHELLLKHIEKCIT